MTRSVGIESSSVICFILDQNRVPFARILLRTWN